MNIYSFTYLFFIIFRFFFFFFFIFIYIRYDFNQIDFFHGWFQSFELFLTILSIKWRCLCNVTANVLHCDIVVSWKSSNIITFTFVLIPLGMV